MEYFFIIAYTILMEERFLPIGIQDFEKLRKGGYVYVDKTKYVYELARLSTPFFFEQAKTLWKKSFAFNIRGIFPWKERAV